MMRLHRLVFLAALLVFASVHPEAGATIRRTPGSWLFGQRAAFSDGTPKPWVQFGLEVANTTGSRVEVCNGALLVDPKER